MRPPDDIPAAYQALIAHLHTIVGGRDRTSLNGALLLAVRALFQTRRVSLFRVVRHKGISFVIPCGTAIGDKPELQDAYLISPQLGHPLAGHPLYQQCCDSAGPIHTTQAGMHRHVFPLFQHEFPYALLELERESPLLAHEATLLGQFIGLFLDHLALIDYAETDTLTGLLNRKTFDENLARVLASVGNDDAPGDNRPHPHRRHAKHEDVANWLAVVDIDHFKRVNDTYGHIIGDEVLLLVAGQMRRSFRFDDQLFRFGGEEFVAVLQPATQADAFAVLDRFRHSIEAQDFPIVGRMTISIGFTRIDGMDTPTELVGRADQALYFAKRNGRNRVEGHEALHAAGLVFEAHADKPKVELF